MEMYGQISNGNKSEMSNWAKQYSYQLTAEQIQAVENNDCSKFKTTSGGKETMSQIWKEQPFGGDCFGQKYAESYDEASWFRARCAFLQYRNYELEAQMKEDEDKEVEEEEEECEECGNCYECGICVCDPSMHIFLYEKGDEDRTLCCECGQDCYKEYKSEGWKRDQDDSEDEE